MCREIGITLTFITMTILQYCSSREVIMEVVTSVVALITNNMRVTVENVDEQCDIN